MTIAGFFTSTFIVYRMDWDVDASGNEFSAEQQIGTFTGHMQQSDMDLAQHLGLAFTKAFSIWCPLSTDVAEGDTLISGSYRYRVRAVRMLDVGANKHLELACERELTPEA